MTATIQPPCPRAISDRMIDDLERALAAGEPAVASAALGLMEATIGFTADQPDWLYLFVLSAEHIALARHLARELDMPTFGEPAAEFIDRCLRAAGAEWLDTDPELLP